MTSLKRISTCIFFALIFMGGKAQSDSSNYSILTVKPEYGVFFPANKFLQDFYKAKAFLSWGIGSEIGKSRSGITFLVNFSHTGSGTDSIRYDSTSKTNSVHSYSVKRNQFSVGIVNHLKISGKAFFIFKSIVAANFIREELHDVNETSFGLILSAGIENKISKRFSTYMDFGYDFVTVPSYDISGTNNNQPNYFQPKDWSGFFLKAGININLLNN